MNNKQLKLQILKELEEKTGLLFHLVDDEKKKELLNSLVLAAEEAGVDSVSFSEKVFDGFNTMTIGDYTVNLKAQSVVAKKSFEARNNYLPICSKRHQWTLLKKGSEEEESLEITEIYYDGTGENSVKRETVIKSNDDYVRIFTKRLGKKAKYRMKDKDSLVLGQGNQSHKKTYCDIFKVPSRLKEQCDFIFDVIYKDQKVKAIKK